MASEYRQVALRCSRQNSLQLRGMKESLLLYKRGPHRFQSDHNLYGLSRLSVKISIHMDIDDLVVVTGRGSSRYGG